jgi:hypothetical protein
MSKPILATSRIKSDVEAHHINLRTRGVLSETYDLEWLFGKKSESCKTGCWRYDDATGRHVIRMSPLAYDSIATDKTKRVLVSELFRNVYEHEAAHSKYTTKDLKGFGEKLKAEKIPWRLFNLFEDCRIEQEWVRSQRKFKAFNWLRWDKHPEPLDLPKVSATMLLYRFKVNGIKNSRYRMRLPREMRFAFSGLKFYHKVESYFWEIIQQRTSEDLIPIMIRWLKDFPSTGDDTIKEEGGLGTGDVGEAIKEASGKAPTNVVANDKQGEGASAETRGEKGSSADGGKGSGAEETGKAIEEGGGEGYGSPTGDESKPFSGETPPANPAELEEFMLSHRLAGMLDTAFRAKGDGRETTSNPSKKLNVRGILRGDLVRPYVGKAPSERGKPHVSLVFDCSGSMSNAAFIDRERTKPSRADIAGRVLLRALNVLAKKGRITAIAYASSAGGVRERVVLPVRDTSVFKKFHGWSDHEGLGYALDPKTKQYDPRENGLLSDGHHRSAFNEIVSKSRLCIVYTDGAITDAPVKREPLKARGLYTLGVCCAASDRTAALRHHFDGFVSRESLWGVADALVRQLKSLPAR